MLVAEDNELNWEIAEAILSDLGMELDWAENGQICVEKFKRSAPGWYDVILMDIRMPVMTGFEAATAIRALDREDAATIPILAISADASSEPSGDGSAGQQEIALTLWVFPVGNWGKPTSVSSVLTRFHQEHPDIHVSVEFLDYASGDAAIEQAVAEGRAPDLVLEGPERLVANWGDRGLMADLSDLWEEPQSERIYETVRNACRHSSGAYYEYPICMSAHCMAINYDMFQEAGALQYIDEEAHTWTTEGFVQAVQALTAYGHERAGIVYCKGQAGDQGTRARVDAAKTLIRFLTQKDAQYTRTVRISTNWPVRDMENVYVNDTLMEEYSIFLPYAGDYYQVTPGWTEARAAWWQLLQKVGAGSDIQEAVKGFPR